MASLAPEYLKMCQDISELFCDLQYLKTALKNT